MITKILKLTLFAAFFIAPFAVVNAQEEDDDLHLIQFSGVVLDGDSLNPLPFTTVIIDNTKRGTTTDFYGYFSFVAEPADTIRFSSVGYHTDYYVIPDTLEGNRYSMIQVLSRDTVELSEVTIYPWPDKDEFKEAFLSLRLPSDDLQRAQRNLSKDMMTAKMMNMSMHDGSANFKYQMYQRNRTIYEAGQYPSFTILNPVAWAQFIQAWKDGAFKKDY